MNTTDIQYKLIIVIELVNLVNFGQYTKEP